MMPILLDLSFVSASFAILCVLYATHGTSLLYRLALYVLSLVFFICFVLSLFSLLSLTIAGLMVCMAIAGAGAVTTYIRIRSWNENERGISLVRFAVVLPVVLFAAVAIERVVIERTRARIPKSKTTASDTSRIDSLKRQWRKLKPITLTVGLLGWAGLSIGQTIPFHPLPPDCCLQAMHLRLDLLRLQGEQQAGRDSLTRLNNRYRQLYQTGEALMAEQTNQMEQAQAQALTAEALLGTLQTENARLHAENARWVPRTKIGVRLRGIRNGLAVVGGLSLSAAILTLFR